MIYWIYIFHPSPSHTYFINTFMCVVKPFNAFAPWLIILTTYFLLGRNLEQILSSSIFVLNAQEIACHDSKNQRQDENANSQYKQSSNNIHH